MAENHLREFQEEAKNRIIQGESIIVIAPTGLGKTCAGILPFINSLSQKSNTKLGIRIIYSLPIRALSRGVYEEFNNFGINPVVHHGEEPESKIFSETAIITTIDQYFTAFAGTPLSWSSTVSHAAAGGVLTSYSVFDEAHLLNPKHALQLLFAILKLRKRWALPTTVMSATLPDSLISFLEKTCGLMRVEATENDVMKRDEWRDVSLAFYEKELSIKEFSELIKDKYREQRKIIVFVNTVERAINVYKELNHALGDQVLLAHSRFTKIHRKEIEEKIHNRFGKNSSSQEGILITTQVSEAGLNISAPLVITELAPMDSIIQRAGRCARFKEDSNTVKGHIIVVKPKAEDEKSLHAPYFDNIIIKKGGETKTNREDAWLRKNKEGRIYLTELTELVLLDKLESSNQLRLKWDVEKELINNTLSEAYAAYIGGDNKVYFKDTLKNQQLGEILEKYKDKLEER